MTSTVSLVILGAFFLNLPLQMGIGVNDVFLGKKTSLFDAFLETLLLFISLLFQWVLFVFVFSPLSIDHLKWFLLLPLNAVVPNVLAIVVHKILPGKAVEKEKVFLYPYKSGAGLAAILVIVHLADSWSAALVLAAAFSLGMFFSVATLKAIRFRVGRESVSPLLRGAPLLLIAMGILSLVLNSVALIYLR